MISARSNGETRNTVHASATPAPASSAIQRLRNSEPRSEPTRWDVPLGNHTACSGEIAKELPSMATVNTPETA